MDLTQLTPFVRDVGFPIAMIVVMMRAIGSAGAFVAPLIQRVIVAHIDFLDALRNNDTRKTDVMESQEQLLSKNTEWLGEIHKAVVRENRS